MAAQVRETFSILLVDDDPMVVRVLSKILGDFAPIRFATSGRTALKLARASLPDLVLLDVEMPDLSGFEVCKEFKSDPELREVPIIFITSHDSAQLETVGIRLGGADFISKPPNAALVLARVRTYYRLKMLSDTMRTSVTMDFLTGAVTRRQLEKALTQEWLRAQRSLAPLGFLLLEVDGFTAVSAECGEEWGDVCLKSVADALRLVAKRPTDMLGRWGGGTFALLLPETPSPGPRIVAQRAIDAVDALQLSSATPGGAERRVTLSVGGSCLDSSHAAASGGFPDSSVAARIHGAIPEKVIAAAAQALKSVAADGGHQSRFIDTASRGAAQAVSA